MGKNHIRELSKRERQLVQLASQGHTDSSIANLLEISEATVGTYWARVRLKVDAFSRPEIIAKVIRKEVQDTIRALKRSNQQLLEQLHNSPIHPQMSSNISDYRKLIEKAPEAILVVIDNGTMEMVNDELCDLFGFQREELEGHHLQVLIPVRFCSVHKELLENFMLHPQKRKMAEHSMALARHKSGREFQITASFAPVTMESGMRVVCILREILGSRGNNRTA